MRASGVRVGASRIAGQGVFAARDFRPAETVLILDDSRVVDAVHPLDAGAGELARHCDYLAGGRVVLMPWPERYINSSCEPNTYVITRDGVRHVVAVSVIAEGDEITFFDLPRDDQRRLRHLLDGWFVAEHAARLRALDDGERAP